MKKRKNKKKRINKSFIAPIFIPTMFGARLNLNNWNQLWRLDDLTEIKIN